MRVSSQLTRHPNAVVRLLFLALFLALCSSEAMTQVEPDYVIGPQDVLSIAVWDQPDLMGKFAVETDGSFTFPLIGRIKAGGRTLKQLERDLIDRLKDGFFVNPQVSIAIEQYRSQRIFVMGEVRAPGPQSLTGEMTLVEVLSRAGSTLPSAGDEAIIVRPRGTGPGSLQPAQIDQPASPPTEAALLNAAQAASTDVVRVDIRDLQNGILTQNIRLRDGDTVFVPKAPTVFVSGQVKLPGEYPVRRETTVLQALSLAGGVTDRGATGRIRVRRVVDGTIKQFTAGLNDPVQPGDTIEVPERFF